MYLRVHATKPEVSILDVNLALSNFFNHLASQSGFSFSPRPVTGNFRVNFTLEVSGCESGTPVIYLEHVQVLATIRFGKRGDLKLTLFSPRGTTSVLLPPRPQVSFKFCSKFFCFFFS